MTQEERDILLKDICARLPYNVKAYVKNWSNIDRKYYEGVYDVKSAFPSLNEIHVQSKSGSVDVTLGYYDHEFKPYLFPQSNMTQEQMVEYYNTLFLDDDCNKFLTVKSLEWLYKNHIDIYGLIPMGLAIDATGLGIYE